MKLLRIPVRPALLALLLTGCSSATHFVDPEADLGFYERFAILPLASLAVDRVAGEKVANVLFSELLASRFAPAVDPGQLSAAMVTVRGGTPPTNPWSQAELAKLSHEVGAQGFFEGVVREYTLERAGRDAFPLISFELRFVDAASGRVVWTWSDTRSGGPAFPLWPFNEIRTLGELSTKMCRDAVATLR